MSGDNSASARSAPIDLAREADFILGGATISPSQGEVTAAGRRIRLQRRVMQVLVALTRAGAQVVSRNDLLASCWGGLAVGDDAINRCIGRLRRLGDVETGGAFAIETLPRIGYRLTPGPTERPGSPAAPTLTTVPYEAMPVLAVLAFDNLCEGGDMAWFTDGVSEEIQQTVARAKGLKVIGRASSFQFRGADKAAANVAAALGVTHVLDGSVRRSGARVRISTQLIDCADQITLWSERFDRGLSDIFALQDEIAGAVATALEAAFAASRPQAVDPGAFDLYLRAQSLVREGSWKAEKSAEIFELLERVVASDPAFARAWGALALQRAWWLRFDPGAQHRGLTRAAAVHAAETALALDPALGVAYEALSYLEPFGAYRQRAVLQQKALNAAPYDPEVLNFHSRFCQVVGRNDAAVDYAKQAHDLDPLDARVASHYAGALGAADRYPESLALWDAILDRWPQSDSAAFVGMFWAGSHADWGRFGAIVRSAHARDKALPWMNDTIASFSKLRDSDTDYWNAALGQARQALVETGTVQLQTLTYLHASGLEEETFQLIDRASYAHIHDPDGRSPADGMSPGIIFWPLNKQMMRDPRFVGLCAKLGLCDYWLETDRWPDCAATLQPYYDFKAACRGLAGRKI